MLASGTILTKKFAKAHEAQVWVLESSRGSVNTNWDEDDEGLEVAVSGQYCPDWAVLSLDKVKLMAVDEAFRGFNHHALSGAI